MDFNIPVTMPRSTHYGNNYFVVYSNKIHRTCNFFSNLEYYNFLTLEINPEVDKFCEQPLKIKIVQNNELKYAIFDMWVRYRNGREEMQEVKYNTELIDNIRSQEQIRREEIWCRENGIDFCVRTDKTISKGRFFLNNANIIASRLRRYIPTESAFYNPRIIKTLEQYNSLTIAELIENEMLPINNEVNHLCYMYEKGLIKMNIEDQPLGDKTEVSLWQK